MPTVVVPVGERFYWGKVPVGVNMEAKEGSEVCVCVCVCHTIRLNKLHFSERKLVNQSISTGTQQEG